ncbi:MAG: hypothetical protein ABEL76_12640 [Bradymonadaceae bacterium]
MEIEWNGHTLEVSGDWTYRWLFLAPEYELKIDGQLLDRGGGPVPRPHLEGLFEDESGEIHHIEADLLSIFGFQPTCDLAVDEEPVASDKVHVDNILNPFLVLFILVATAAMVWVGPDLLQQYWQQL